ncbi:MAG: DUF490 domain-containing protein, partial [Rubrivivax sp.]|nr:DUF490 domain-containing protein [Rubrivivax sp.]
MTETTPAPGPTKAPPGGPWRAAWHLLQPVLGVGLLLALVVALSAWGVVWLLRSAEGTAWLLGRVPSLEVQGLQGALLSDRFQAERLTVRWDRGQQWVRIDRLRAEGLAWSWHPAPGAWLGLHAQALAADRVEVNTGPAGPRPITMPRSMQLPLRLQVDQAEVAELQIDQLKPMHQVLVRGVRLWEPGGREYHADRATFRWDRALVDGTVSLGALPPFTLQAQAALRSADGTEAWGAWTAELRAQGPLARFELSAQLQGKAAPGGTTPRLQLDAAITPLQAWALGRIRAHTQSLDLAALATGAPRTALSGHVDLDTRAAGGPLEARVELDNAVPGRWSDGRVPVRRLQARLRSPEADRSRLLIEQFEARLAQGTDDAGTLSGTGRWTGPRLQLELQVDNLRPQRVDARAAAMTLGGTVSLDLSGLPSPDPGAAAPPRAPARSAELRGTLEGRLDGNAQAVRLVVDGGADAQRIELRDLRAEAGPARAQLSLNAQRGGSSGPWQVRSSGTLSDFDPLPWWPGTDGSPWRAGPHRVSGGWSIDVQLPPQPQGLSPLAVLQGLAGTGQLRLERSQLAGVPLSAQLELAQRPSQAATPYSLQGELALGGNRVVLNGQGNPLGDGHADALKLEIQAEQLAALAPLVRLLPEGSHWQPRSGSLRADVDLHGRWPAMRSAGRAALQDLQLGNLQARQ